MAQWESVSPSETLAEVEAVLENQGETERILSDLNADPQVMEWRETVRLLCKEIIDDRAVFSLTPDILFEELAPRAREMFPPEAKAKLRGKLEVFLQTQFEDHITK
jgi:hypothetical protein